MAGLIVNVSHSPPPFFIACAKSHLLLVRLSAATPKRRNCDTMLNNNQALSQSAPKEPNPLRQRKHLMALHPVPISTDSIITCAHTHTLNTHTHTHTHTHTLNTHIQTHTSVDGFMPPRYA